MTESDVELLRLAAKAAGLKVKNRVEVVDADDRFLGIKVRKAQERYALWNPLEDDGEALRLAVDLGLGIDRTATEWVTVWIPGGGCTGSTKLDDHPHRATRRAIVRAAAEIGRNMKET